MSRIRTRIALVVHRIGDLVDVNFQNIIRFINKATDKKADLVLFSESALTGLINNGDPIHDLSLGVEIPGTETDSL